MYLRMYLCQNLSLSMFLECSYFFTKSEADVLINSVLRQNTACMQRTYIAYATYVAYATHFLQKAIFSRCAR